MAIDFPLSNGAFWSKIRFAGRPEFMLAHYQQQSLTGGGDILIAKFGESKWTADIAIEGGLHAANQQTLAMLKALAARNGSFLAYDIRQPYPAYDPTGSIVSGASVQVRTKGSDNRSLSLKGFSGVYQLAVGEKISVSNGSGKRALLELMEPASAGGPGNTEVFEVQPFLPVWLAVDQAVDIVKPQGKFKLVPGSHRPSSGSGNLADGSSFTMISMP